MGPLGIPIDHVLGSGIRLADLQALPSIGSDHRPLKALLFLPTTADESGRLWDIRASEPTSH
jgi:endonuclease/exonuclease/phosphatase (EEP) superfamily protein YafD